MTDKATILNPEQRRAVASHKGPLLIIAGAGSGKTRVITQRIIEMLKEGIPQRSILALTFTNKAAREMLDRVTQNAGKRLRRLTISTFHSFGMQVLKKHAELLGWRKNFSIYDSMDQKSFIRECARELSWNFEMLNLNHAVQTFSLIKTGRGKWSDDEVDDSLQPLYTEYQNCLRLYNAMDFDDLIQLPIKLFQQNADILEDYRQRYRYIMVDEFQDTSMQQYRLMKLLADGSRNICVVGDDDQSIYSWRGANFNNLRNFERDYPERTEIKLEQNYRSTGAILDAANHLIKHNRQRKKKRLWTGGEDGKAIELFYPADERSEAQWIANLIRTLKFRDDVRQHDIAVLMRTNKLSRPIEEEFLARNIAYKLSGGTSLFERAEIKDMAAYLRWLSNPDDDVSLLRILKTPPRGIGKRTLEEMNKAAQGQSLYRAMQELIQTADGRLTTRSLAVLEEFSALVHSFRPKFLSGKNLAASLRELLDEIDYRGYLLTEFQHDEKIATFRWKNVEAFTTILEQWEQNPDKTGSSIFDYLNRIALFGREVKGEDGKVNLMTIHSAKGLEFDVVCIAGVEEDIIPHKRSLEENGVYEDTLEEERRLFYVALTRAKRKLYLTSCRQRRILRELVDMNISPFVAEIPPELIEITEPESEVSEEDAENFFTFMKTRFGEGEG